MVTTVILPALRRSELGPDWRQAFNAIERRFVWQARSAVILVGATGLYMVIRLGLWSRFREAQFWWMHAMVAVWFIFAVALFVVEPFISSHRRHVPVATTSAATWSRLARVHIVLLVLSLIAVLSAVAGSHGWIFSRR